MSYPSPEEVSGADTDRILMLLRQLALYGPTSKALILKRAEELFLADHPEYEPVGQEVALGIDDSYLRQATEQVINERVVTFQRIDAASIQFGEQRVVEREEKEDE